MDLLVLGHSAQSKLVKLLMVKSLSWFMNWLSLWTGKLKSNLMRVKYNIIRSPSLLCKFEIASHKYIIRINNQGKENVPFCSNEQGIIRFGVKRFFFLNFKI